MQNTFSKIASGVVAGISAANKQEKSECNRRECDVGRCGKALLKDSGKNYNPYTFNETQSC